MKVGEIQMSNQWYTIDRSKKFAVIDEGKIISKHVDFYNVQLAIERHFRNRKISNNYKIVSLQDLKIKKEGEKMSKIYVVTSGRRINLILHHEKFSKMNDAIKKAKKLKKEGKKYVAIKSYKKGEVLSHERYV